MKTDYKHNATFKVRGLVYKYDKTFGVWTLKTRLKKGFETIPRTQRPPSIHAMGSYWEAGQSRGLTPDAALASWFRSANKILEERRKVALFRLKVVEREIALYASNNWAGRKKRR